MRFLHSGAFKQARLGILFALSSALIVAQAHAAPVRVKVSEVVRSQFFVPMYVALGKGFAKSRDLDIELITSNGGDKVGALILSGGADIGLAGPEIPIYIFNNESTDKPVIFCALTGTDGFYFASRKKIDNFSWDKVSGKILGFRPGTTPEMFLEHVLKAHGVNESVLSSGMITNLALPAREGAWISGTGDFGIFQEPSLSKLERAGLLHVITSIGKEVGRADYTVFFARKAWLSSNSEAAQKWTDAISDAQKWMKSASSQEIVQVISPFFPGISTEDSLALVERYRNAGAPIWSDTPLVERKGLEMVQKIMVEGGTLTEAKIVPYDSIVDERFAAKAMGSK
jgi:NitT/TauT family transport system substrate-binding protein